MLPSELLVNRPFSAHPACPSSRAAGSRSVGAKGLARLEAAAARSSFLSKAATFALQQADMTRLQGTPSVTACRALNKHKSRASVCL